MNIGIVGYRHFNDYELFKKIVDQYVYLGCTIISGGCTGTDTLAERYADEHKLEKKCTYLILLKEQVDSMQGINKLLKIQINSLHF